MDNEPIGEFPRPRGVTFFKPGDIIHNLPDTKNPAFNSEEVKVGDLGIAQLYGEQDYLPEELHIKGFAIIDGRLVWKTLQEFKKMGYYQMGVAVKGALPQEGKSVWCTMQIPTKDSTVEGISSITIFMSAPERHPDQEFVGNAYRWTLPGDSEAYRFCAPKNPELLSKLEFFFQPKI